MGLLGNWIFVFYLLIIIYIIILGKWEEFCLDWIYYRLVNYKLKIEN